MENLVGKVYGRLTIIAFSRKNSGGNAMWLCRCECGKEKVCRGADMKRGLTKSCGCFSRQRTSEIMKTHGRSRTAEYRSWCNIIQRCTSPTHPRFASYGGRGIRICKRWRESFETFLADMGKKPTVRHSVERENNDGNYEPSNCRWATPAEQNQNTRINRKITHDGRTLTYSQWSEITGLSRGAIKYRVNHGRTPEQTLTMKPRQRITTRH